MDGGDMDQLELPAVVEPIVVQDFALLQFPTNVFVFS